MSLISEENEKEKDVEVLMEKHSVWHSGKRRQGLDQDCKRRVV